AFVDWDKVFFALQQYKSEKHWYNLSFTKEALREIINNRNWYNLFIPATELEIKFFAQTFIWEELAIALLKKYVEKYYNYHKNLFNSEHIETKVLQATDDNIVLEYEVKLNTEKSIETIQQNIDRLLEQIATQS